MALGNEARLIGLDWGTSSLRAYLFDGTGEVKAEKSAPSGVMYLERFRPEGRHDTPREKLFEAALRDICRDWPAECVRELPVIACGMVGSSVGWSEASYLETPVDASALSGKLTVTSRAEGGPIHIVPGICSPGELGKSLPEILRGEETQIAGILARPGTEGSFSIAEWLIGLPGTHSKWVVVSGRKIAAFTTFVTGELYALLRGHSVIAKSEEPLDAKDEEAFGAGLQIARRPDAEGAGGVLSTIFSTRSKRVLGQLKAEQQPDYLSGLLIGEELTGLERILSRDHRRLTDFSHIILSGDSNLCARYCSAFRELSWPAAESVPNATERGLWKIASESGLLD